jgi:hypothetical protein
LSKTSAALLWGSPIQLFASAGHRAGAFSKKPIGGYHAKQRCQHCDTRVRLVFEIMSDHSSD